MNQPLDNDTDFIEDKKPKLLIAQLLELVPLLFVMLGIILRNATIITLSMTFLSFIFLGAGWFIFRRKKYTAGSITFAVVTSIILAAGVLAILFQILNWEGLIDMKLATFPMLIIGLIANIIWYIFSKKKEEEGGFSLKMLLRLAVFAGLLYYL
ncbi:MAG: hypothetical protein AAFZ15_15995 [Bacteroidota bacterium]